MWGGVMEYNFTPTVLEAEAAAFSAFMDPENFDELADMVIQQASLEAVRSLILVQSIILTYKNPGSVFGVINSLFYSANEAYPKTLSNFTSIPSTANTLAIQNVAELVTAFGEILPATLNR